MDTKRTVKTLCGMCDHGCGIRVTVENGEPVAIRGDPDHPHSRGWLCAKGRAGLELFRSPQRLTQPQIRVDGELVPTGWENAFRRAAEELHRLKDRYGPESVAIYQGEGIGHQEIKSYMKRFANVYGTPNFMGVGSVCNAAKTLGETLTYGGITKPDIANTRLLLVWGGNPLVSHEPFTPPELRKFQRRGGRLVVVDPRRTETASRADLHLAIRPGTDPWLLLSMIHVLFREELWDRTFADEWVEGLQRLAEVTGKSGWSPEHTAQLTGVEPDQVRTAVRWYAEAKPACIHTGNGIEHHPSGVTTARLLALLRALTGNLDVPGGDLFTPRPRLTDITSPLPAAKTAPLGMDRFPLFCQARKEAHALCLADAVLDERPYPIKGMIIAGGNPSLEWPDSSRVRAVLERLEFLLVIDVVRSPDCGFADVVLPACTFLERDEHRVCVYENLAYVTLRSQVVKPRFGLEDQRIWVELAQQMGFGEHFPWNTCREGVDHILEGLGVSWDGIEERGGVHEYAEQRHRKYLASGFDTPSGKVEVAPEKLRWLGLDPFPLPEEARPTSRDDRRYPLTLITGGNLPGYTHWQYRYIEKLHRLAPEPLAEIHPDTAARHNVEGGDAVEVGTAHGSVHLKAHLTGSTRPGTVHLAQGWAEANANELTSHDELDPVSGFPNLKSVPCWVRRVG